MCIPAKVLPILSPINRTFYLWGYISTTASFQGVGFDFQLATDSAFSLILERYPIIIPLFRRSFVSTGAVIPVSHFDKHGHKFLRMLTLCFSTGLVVVL